MKAIFSAPKRGWLVATIAVGALAVGSCGDNSVTPTTKAIPASAANPDAGVGNAITLTYPLTADPVYGSAWFVVPDSVQFKHESWVQVSASGSVRRVATYPWTEVPNDTTFDASQGFSFVDIGNQQRIFFGTSPIDVHFYVTSGYKAPAGVGYNGHGAGTIGIDNYAPPGYPHVDCGPYKPIHCETYTGSITITIKPYHSDMVLVADSTMYHPGSIATFNLTLNPTTVNGHGIPYVADSSWWVPDSPGDGGDPSEQAMSGPGIAALNNPSAGRRVVVGSGTLSISAWVNGEWQRKSVHINAPSLNLVAEPGRIHPGDSVKFTPSWTDGASVTSVNGWTWTASNPPGATTTTACAGLVVCKTKVQEPGTMKVTVVRNGVTRTATAHVTVYSTFRLDADNVTPNYGDSVTFTPKYDDSPGPAMRWRWVPADTSVHDTLACDPGITNCKKQILESGTMWAYVSSTAGSGDSASKSVTMRNHLELHAAPALVAPGGVVTFRPYLNGHPTQAVSWKWMPDATAPWDIVAGCAAPALECHRMTFESGTMWAHDSLSDSASVDVFVNASCGGGLFLRGKQRGVGLAARQAHTAVRSSTRAPVAQPAAQPFRSVSRVPGSRPSRALDCSDTTSTYSDTGTDSLPKVVLHVILDGKGVNGLPAAGDWMLPVGTVVRYSYWPLSGFDPVVVWADTLLSDTIPSGKITLADSTILEAASDSNWNLRPGIRDLRTRARNIAAALTPSDKVAAWAKLLKWAVDSAYSPTLERDLAIAEYLEFDPTTNDSTLLGALDDALANHAFEITGDSINGHTINILESNDYKQTPIVTITSAPRRPRAPRRDVGTGGNPTKIVYVNGINTFGNAADRSAALLANLVRLSNQFPNASVTHYWNRNIRTSANGYNFLGCAGLELRDASIRETVVALMRYKKCKQLNWGPSNLAGDLFNSTNQFWNSQFAMALNPTNPDVDSLAQFLAYYHGRGYSTIGVTHSQGNMVVGQALQFLSRYDTTQKCFGVLSLASPIKHLGFDFGLMDTLHLKGFSIPGDMLLVLGFPNDFDQTHYSDTAVVAAAQISRVRSFGNFASPAMGQTLAWLYGLKWGPRIHAVDQNYFQGNLAPYVRSTLQQLYQQCTSEH
jgi:hypothetical protein